MADSVQLQQITGRANPIGTIVPSKTIKWMEAYSVKDPPSFTLEAGHELHDRDLRQHQIAFNTTLAAG